MDEQWRDFFTAIASATGAIFALLFLSLQVREIRWRGNLIRTYSTGLALLELAAPLFVSLIALIPPHHWQAAAGAIGIVGLVVLFGFLTTFGVERIRHRHPFQALDWYQFSGSFLVSGTVYVALLSQAWADERGLGRIGFLCVWLTISGVT
ncbi:hypothetical protein ACW9HQ_47655, partial [Nocardia gipuzkoensis]